MIKYFVCRDCIKNHTEYTEKFDKIIEENNKFAVDMLDLCRSQEEAELVLSNTIIPDDFQFKGETNPFQLLKIGLMNSNYDFIAHDYTQQALRERMAQSDDGQVKVLLFRQILHTASKCDCLGHTFVEFNSCGWKGVLCGHYMFFDAFLPFYENFLGYEFTFYLSASGQICRN